MTSTRLTSRNLMRLGRGSSLTPSWAPTNASQFLSSGASSSRYPMDYRIQHTKGQVRFYMDQLLQIQPEGEQVVRQADVQKDGQMSVCFKRPVAPRSDVKTLASWKRVQYYFKQQLFQITQQRFGTPPVSPTLSELAAEHRMEAAGAERKLRTLQQQIEAWLHHLPGTIRRPRPIPSILAAPPRRSRRLAQLPPEFCPLRPRRRRKRLDRKDTT